MLNSSEEFYFDKKNLIILLFEKIINDSSNNSILCLHLYVTDISVNWYVHIFSFYVIDLGEKRTIIYRATMKFKMDIWFVRTISEKNIKKKT